MHVSLTAESLGHIGPLTITNSLFTTWLVVGVIALFAIIFRLRLKKYPQGMQNIVEAVIDGFHGIVEGVAENKKLARKFFAPIFTIFLFVLLNNWAGLIPGVGSVGISHAEAVGAHEESHEVSEPALHSEAEDGSVSHEVHEKEIESGRTEHNDVMTHDHSTEHSEGSEHHGAESTHGESHHSPFTPIFRPGTADLSFTLALAVCAVGMVQFMGVRKFGIWGYFSRFLNFKNPVLFFVGILEIVSEFSKMISFSFRLFGNIFAGEVLLTVIIALAPVIAPMPFYGLEIFVGLVQALVFAMLTLVFFRMSTSAAH